MKSVMARCAVILGITMCGLGSIAGLAQSEGSSANWFRISLNGGKLNGVKWGLSATGLKERPLKRVCAVMTEVAPPEPGTEFAEGSETTSCGRLLQATDSITLSSDFPSDNSDATELRATLYPKDVRKVTFILADGQRSTIRARGINVKSRKIKGIPFFRYLVARFSAGACVEQVVSYDRAGRVIHREKGDRSCP